MSDNPPSISSTAFADALARARQLAAKLGSASSGASSAVSPPGGGSAGVKRSADDFQSGSPEPEAKRMASLSDPFGAQLAAMRSSSAGTTGTSNFAFPMGMGISGSGKACTEEVHIPDGLVGLIIGRGGEQVSRIQAETGCKVQVAPDNGTGKDRSCYLQGTKESIERAKDLIMEIVSSKSHELGRAGGVPSVGAGGAPGIVAKGGGTTSIEMTIPGAKVGLIIGKGGETIRSLQDKSGTKMYILQDNMFEECDKPLRIVGEPDLVEHARQLVFDLITETPPKPDFFKPKSEYGGPGGPGLGSGGGSGGGGGGGGFGGPGMETMKFPVPKISVGLIIGKGGEMIKRIQMETGAKVQFDPINSNLGDMDEQLAIITGKPDQIRQAQLRIEDLVETALHGGKPGEGGPPGGGGGGGGGGGPGRGGPMGRHNDRHENNWGDRGPGQGGHHQGKVPRDFEEERMPVPVGRVGMVIGKGGETIRSINQQSGAHCEIDRNGPSDGPERIFLIRGNRQQIEHAKDLIMEKVNTLPPKQGQRDRGPGGGHHHGGDPYGGGGGGGGWGQHYGGQPQQQWGQQGQGQDPSKMGDASAQWAAYYAQYYGQAQQTPQQNQQGGGGQQADYTQQWIEYLRAQGQHQQADMLEQQMKASKGGGESNPAPPGSNAPAPPGTNPPAPGTGGASNGNPGAAGQNGQSVDYSQQWADHYRSLGKIQEAEAIEAYIKSQKQSGGGQPPAPGAGAQPGGAPGGQQGGYPGGGGYPGAGYYNYNYNYPGYGYPGGGNPGQGGMPGGPNPNNNGTAPPGTAPPPPGESDK